MEHYSEACGEMDFIINNLDKSISDKIPDKFKNMFKENKPRNYKTNLVVDKPLYEQKLLEETEIFIQILYKLFLASKSEKNEYIAESRKLYVEKNKERWLNAKS